MQVCCVYVVLQHYPYIENMFLVNSLNSFSALSSVSPSFSTDTKSAFTISKDPEVGQATPETLHKLYREQKTHPGYKSLLDTGIFVTGAIDDHDYGVNNG
mgnify:CR=1 FL=1